MKEISNEGNEKINFYAYVLRNKLYLCQYRRVESVNERCKKMLIQEISVKDKEGAT